MGKHLGKGKMIYFGEDEWDIVEKNAKQIGIDTTKYIKRMAISGYIITYNMDKLNDLIYEINKVGININQVVKKTNEIDCVYKEDIKQLIDKLDEIYNLITKMYS